MNVTEILLLVLLAAVAGAALKYLPVQRAREEKEKKRQALRGEYADMVISLTLLMNAGLSLRSSWERLVRDYRKERENGGPRREVYEEMEETAREMLGGMFEDRAYGNFGRRCGTPEYLRLGGMLETYVRQGNRKLPELLAQEAAQSLEVELREVRKRGEKTTASLLIPTVVLFALTLLLVTVPAFMNLKSNI